LEAGVDKLHLRKPGGSVGVEPGGAVGGLLERLAPRWAGRLVVHGGDVALAGRYGVGQVHGAVGMAGGLVVSTSVHTWEELMGLPVWVAYAFISPVFDSISKPGYRANAELLTMAPGPYPCRPVGLGGVTADNIGLMIERGWMGAAVLGWIWEAPRKAVSRFERLKKIIDGQAKGIGGSGI